MTNDNQEFSETKKYAHRIKIFKFSMYILSLLYLGGALFFFFIPDGVYYILNFPPIFLKILNPLPEKNSDFFWLPLVASLMIILSFLAYLSAKEPKNKPLINLHIISKLISSLCYLYLFIFSSHIFGYLVGFVLDFFICLYVLYLKMSIATINEIT